ncbi:carbonic anhydrase [Mycena belliarum]|uniref:Carbonic anhydrase n=1 Tax=Mycena belliarum TaxID=1033014 RepID=A0AAD6Y154_9AGAR|nr:carbonic anhydrase [Mycena belliae]
MFIHKISWAAPRNAIFVLSSFRALSFAKHGEGTADAPVIRPTALPPTKHLAIITCMDARINPFKQLGISEGEAHIIRNAGGMALVISQRLLGTREIAVYHHTGCGMVTFRGPELKRLVKWASPDDTSCAEQVDKIDFLEFKDLEESVKDDVNFLKESPLILKGTKITGWIHHLETGEATRVI